MAALSHAQASKAFEKLRSEIGPKCYLSVSLSIGKHWNSEKLFEASVYPHGVATNADHFSAFDDDLGDLVEATRAKWVELSAALEASTVRKMALEIIRITADLGHCSDAALRASGFDTGQVKRLGERACADATEMASNGPFSIREAGKSNGAPAEAA